MKRRLLAIVMVSCVTVMLIAICPIGGYAQPKPGPSPFIGREPIKIGVNLDLTGIMSETATNVHR